MRSIINATGDLVVSKHSMVWNDEGPTWGIDSAFSIKGCDFSFREAKILVHCSQPQNSPFFFVLDLT